MNITELRTIREGNKLTPKELANKIGVNVSSIYAWEAGEYNPNSTNLMKLNKFFDVQFKPYRFTIIDDPVKRPPYPVMKALNDDDLEPIPEPVTITKDFLLEEASTGGDRVLAVKVSPHMYRALTKLGKERRYTVGDMAWWILKKYLEGKLS